MDVEDQLTVLAAASALSMTKSHVFFAFATNPYDQSQNTVRGISSSRTLAEVFTSDPQNQNLNILESLLIIAPTFPGGSNSASTGGAGDGVGDDNLRRRKRDVQVTARTSGIDQDSDDHLLYISENLSDTARSEAIEPEDGSVDIVNNGFKPRKSISRQSNSVKDNKHKGMQPLSSLNTHIPQNDNNENKQLVSPEISAHRNSLRYIPEYHIEQDPKTAETLHEKETEKEMGTEQNSKYRDINALKVLTKRKSNRKQKLYKTSATFLENQNRFDNDTGHVVQKFRNPTVLRMQLSRDNNVDTYSDTLAQAQGQKVKQDYTERGHLSSQVKLASSKSLTPQPLLFHSEHRQDFNTLFNQVEKRSYASYHGDPKQIHLRKPSSQMDSSVSGKIYPSVSRGNLDIALSSDLHRERRAAQTYVASDTDLDSIYDNVLLICLGVYNHVNLHGAIPSPTQFLDAVVNLTLQGRLGEISVGQGHQVAYDFQVFDFDAGQGSMEGKLTYRTSGEEEWTLSQDLGIAWPDSYFPGPDECFKQVPGCNDGLSTAYIVAVVIAVLGVLTLFVIGAYFGRYANLDDKFKEFKETKMLVDVKHLQVIILQ
ncbi:hypothetical protein ElyMa_006294700 [Elysia marginata]|uniref:Receptor ligand binding region domain-containing protein n=1 Tax=Elysia marginata TaxID=1093978 RepID=A0AAV4HI42_9GAST|nr:hypothetical protein ElyMa_006294700 [Elysia marginata]